MNTISQITSSKDKKLLGFMKTLYSDLKITIFIYDTQDFINISMIHPATDVDHPGFLKFPKGKDTNIYRQEITTFDIKSHTNLFNQLRINIHTVDKVYMIGGKYFQKGRGTSLCIAPRSQYICRLSTEKNWCVWEMSRYRR